MNHIANIFSCFWNVISSIQEFRQIKKEVILAAMCHNGEHADCYSAQAKTTIVFLLNEKRCPPLWHTNSIINISQGFSSTLNNTYIVQRQLPSNNRLYSVVQGTCLPKENPFQDESQKAFLLVKWGDSVIPGDYMTLLMVKGL